MRNAELKTEENRCLTVFHSAFRIPRSALDGSALLLEDTMIRTLAAVAALLALVGSTSAADPKLTVKVEKADPPKELTDAVRKTLDTQAMSVSDEKGKLICTVWAAKALDSKATAD